MRVIRQLMAESLILGVVGGLAGLVLAYGGLSALDAAILDIQKPYWIDIGMDGPSLVFTLAVTLVAAVVAGTLPAVRASGSSIGLILFHVGTRVHRYRAFWMQTGVRVVGSWIAATGLLVLALEWGTRA